MAKALFLDRQRLPESGGVDTPRVAAHPTIFVFSLTHTIKKNTLRLWKAQVFVKASSEPSGFVSPLPTANFAHALLFLLWLDANAFFNWC